MALQEDPTKSFGSTSYFQNKDDERKAVNAVRQEERQKRIATQLLRRNMKKAMRKGEDGGRFIQSAKAADLDIFGRTGLGEEASQAMARARFDVNQNFDAAAKAKAQLEAGVGADGKPVLDANGKSVAGQQIAPQQTTPQQVGNVASAQPAVSNTQPQNKTPKPTAPDWAKDVENDRTFGKGFFDDPANLARIQGITRAEAYDMLNKARVARFMDGITSEAAKARVEEVNALKASQDVANKNQLTPDLRSRLDAMYANPDEFNRQQIKEKEKTYSNIFDNDQFINQVQTRYNEFNNIANNVGKVASQNYKQSPKTAMKQDRRAEIISDIDNKMSLSARQAATNDLKIKAIQESSRNAAMQKAREEYLAFQQKQIVKQYTY